MTNSEIIMVIAVILGPISAVIITLCYQSLSEAKSRKFQIFKTIWDTHHDASIAEYSQAIRMIPVEFRKHEYVRAAWRKYMENVGDKPTPDNQQKHNQQFMDVKNDLISQMAKAIGFEVSEREIRDSIYVATSYVARTDLVKRAEEAQLRIADALEKNVELLDDHSTRIKNDG